MNKPLLGITLVVLLVMTCASGIAQNTKKISENAVGTDLGRPGILIDTLDSVPPLQKMPSYPALPIPNLFQVRGLALKDNSIAIPTKKLDPSKSVRMPGSEALDMRSDVRLDSTSRPR